MSVIGVELAKIITPVFYKLIYMSIKASIIGVIIFVLIRIFKNKISPKVRYLLYLSFIFLLLVPVEFKRENSLLPYKLENLSENAVVEVNEYQEDLEQDIKSVIKINSQNIEKSVVNVKIIIASIWFGIICITLLVYMISYKIFNITMKKERIIDVDILESLEKCKRKLNIDKKINIVYFRKEITPALIGLVNLNIVFDKRIVDLNNKEIEYVIMHELTHYKRKDNLMNILIIILKILYIFNPVVWELLDDVKDSMELAVDEKVSKILNNEDISEYSKLLLKLSSNKKDYLFAKDVAISDNKKILKQRIAVLKNSFTYTKKTIALISIIIVFIIFSIFACCTKEITYNINDISLLLTNVLELEDNYNLKTKIYDNTIPEKIPDGYVVINEEPPDNTSKNYNITYTSILSILNNNNIRYEYLGKEKYNNRECMVISIKLNNNINKVWIDTENGFILKQVRYQNKYSKDELYATEYSYEKIDK